MAEAEPAHPASSRRSLKTVTVLERSGKFSVHHDVTFVTLGEYPTIWFDRDKSIQFGEDMVAAINTFYDKDSAYGG